MGEAAADETADDAGPRARADAPVALLGFGAALVGLPVGLPLRALGALMVAGAVFLLRPGDVPLTRRRLGVGAGLLAVWGALLLMGWPGLGMLLLIPGLIFAAQGLVLLSETSAWSYAARSWRRVLRVGTVVYGVGLLALAAAALGGGGEAARTDSLLGPLGAGWLALPSLLVVRASAHMARDAAQAAGRAVPPWARAARSFLGGLTLLALLLLPVWLLIPLGYHHLTRPDFHTFVATTPGIWAPPPLPVEAERVAFRRDATWITGRVLGLRTAPDDLPFPEGLQSASHRVELDVSHGLETLLRLDQEFIATLDERSGELIGARVRVEELVQARGFHATSAARIDLDGPVQGSAGAGDLIRLVPFSLHVALVSGPGEPWVSAERVRGLPLGQDADVDGAVRPPWPWYLPDAPGVEELLMTSDLPRAGEGLRYLLVVRGQLELRQDGQLAVRISSRTDFKANTLEYAFSAELRETVVTQNADQVSSDARPTPWRNERRWNGRVW